MSEVWLTKINLVLEDLTPYGFKLSSINPLDLDHVKIAYKTMAAMHGQCLAYEQMVSDGKVKPTNSQYEKLKKLNKIEIKDLYPQVVKETAYCEDEPQNPFTKWMIEGVYQIAEVADFLDGYTDQQRITIKNSLPDVLNSVYDLTQYSTR